MTPWWKRLPKEVKSAETTPQIPPRPPGFVEPKELQRAMDVISPPPKPTVGVEQYKLWKELNAPQANLVKAVVTGNPIYVTNPSSLEISSNPTPIELGTYIELAKKDPDDLATRESNIIVGVHRWQETLPSGALPENDNWQWGGPRAKFRIARTQLHKKINDSLKTKLPVKDQELSLESLKAHVEQRGTPK